MHNYYLFQITRMMKICGSYWVTIDKELTKKLWERN